MSTEQRERELDGQGWAAQRAAVEAVWGLLARGYQALDLPPPADPVVYRAMEAAYGPHATPAQLCLLRPYQGDLKTQGRRTVPAWIADDTRRIYEAVQPDRPNAWLTRRISLTDSGAVFKDCITPTTEGNCKFEWFWKGPGQRCSGAAYDWNCYAHKWGGDSHFVLPALRLSFVLARQIASQRAGRSASQIIDDARVYSLMKNLASMQEAEASSVPALAEQQRAAAQAYEENPWGEAKIIADQVFTVAYSVAAAFPPPWNLVAGLAVGVGDAIRRLLPWRHLSWIGEYDAFGKPRPPIQETWISGNPMRLEPPKQLTSEFIAPVVPRPGVSVQGVVMPGVPGAVPGAPPSTEGTAEGISPVATVAGLAGGAAVIGLIASAVLRR